MNILKKRSPKKQTIVGNDSRVSAYFQADKKLKKVAVGPSDDSAQTAKTAETVTSNEFAAASNKVPSSICTCVDARDCAMSDEGDDLTPSAPRKLSVHWGDIEVQKYPIIPGIHPDCCEGPPLTIGWNAFETDHYKTVDEFEGSHHHSGVKEESLRLNWYERTKILRHCGFTVQELEYAQEASSKERRKRQSSARFQKLIKKVSFVEMISTFRTEKQQRRREF